MSAMYKQALNLSNVKRFSRLRLDHEYNVAEHCFRVAILAMMIADDHNSRGGSINVEEVLRKALLHDFEEASISDIPSPTKNRLPAFKAAYKTLGEMILKDDIFKSSPAPEVYLNCWKNDKEGETGEIIKLADMLESLFTTKNELIRSNKTEILQAHEGGVSWFESERGKQLRKKYQLADTLFVEARNL